MITEEIIEKKRNWLRKIKEGTLSNKEFADLKTRKKVMWAEEHLPGLLGKYKGLRIVDKAFRIIYFDHLQLEPEEVPVSNISDNKIRIESRNPCPYLIACQELGLDTRVICSETGEPGYRELAKLIDPRLKFSRNYEKIRPYCAYCEEFIELIL